jgi:hypothetical protein
MSANEEGHWRVRIDARQSFSRAIGRSKLIRSKRISFDYGYQDGSPRGLAPGVDMTAKYVAGLDLNASMLKKQTISSPPLAARTDSKCRPFAVLR